MRRIRYAASLLLLGAAAGAAGTWRYGERVEGLVARVQDKAGRVMARWKPAPAPDRVWELSSGLRLEPHAEGLDYPARIAPVPAQASREGLLYYVGELPGRIRVVDRAGSVSTVAEDLLDFEWPELGELGLMGLTVAPDGTRLYATLTYWDEDAGVYRNRVDALELAPDGRSVQKRIPLLDMRDEATVASYCVQFVEVGPDGLLYVGVGKGADAAAAQNLDRFAGKILRMTREGRAVASNPFFDPDAPESARSYVYALGFRNPFDLAFGPGLAAVVSDVGPGLDRILKLERGRNYCFGRSAGDEAMRCNALFTWGPGGGFAPTGVAFSDGPPHGTDGQPSLYVGVFGSVHMPGPNGGKRIQRFEFDPAGALQSTPQPVARYQGLYYSSVTDVVAIDDALYFADIFGQGELPHRGTGRVYRIVADETATTAQTDPPPATDASPYARGEQLFQEQGCFACHARRPHSDEQVELEGPVLGPDLGERLATRLGGEAYATTLEQLAARTGSYFVERRELYTELGRLEGVDRTRAWLREHIRDPRFDNPESKMPAYPRLSEAELAALVAYLLDER